MDDNIKVIDETKLVEDLTLEEFKEVIQNTDATPLSPEMFSDKIMVKEEIEKFLNNTYSQKDPDFKAVVERLRSFGKGRHQVDVRIENATHFNYLKIPVVGELIAVNIIRGILKF